MSGLITVYVREGRWLLSTSAQSDAGFWVETAASEIGAEPDDAALGAAARAGLGAGGRPRPPKAGTTDNGLLPGLVGLKSWATFAKKAAGVQVTEEGGTVTVTPLRRERSYFVEQLEAASTLPAPLSALADAELGAAVRTALGVATTA